MPICDKPKNKDFRDLEGNRYGRLTVLYFYGRKKSKCYWLCECDCGMFVETRTDALLSSRTKSCGCLQKDIMRDMKETHNYSKTTEYKSFQTAKDRCENENNPYYYNYGGRGIKFNFNSFEDFYSELGNKPNINFSIERINNNGHYEKGNIKWATRQEQLQNRRNTRMEEYNGEIKPLKEWCNIYHINYSTALRRLYTYNLCLDCTFTKKPIKAKKIHCEHKEENNTCRSIKLQS